MQPLIAESERPVPTGGTCVRRVESVSRRNTVQPIEAHMLIFSSAIRITISARGGVLFLYVLHLSGFL